MYGSRAKGDGADDTVLDRVALVGVNTPELERTVDEIACNVMQDHDFKPIISLKVFAEEHIRNGVERRNAAGRCPAWLSSLGKTK